MNKNTKKEEEQTNALNPTQSEIVDELLLVETIVVEQNRKINKLTKIISYLAIALGNMTGQEMNVEAFGLEVDFDELVKEMPERELPPVYS